MRKSIYRSNTSVCLIILLVYTTMASANTYTGANNPVVSSEDKNTEVCRLDVNDEYDLIRMPLMEALDHFENNPHDHMAVDGKCELK